MSPEYEAFAKATSAFEVGFFAAIADSSREGPESWVKMRNGDVLFGYTPDWRQIYYAPIFEAHREAFRQIGLHEHAFGAAFDALISFAYENSLPLFKTAYIPRGSGMILDVGVRAGHWLVRAARHTHWGRPIIGIDAAESAEKLARKHIKANGLESCYFIRAACGAKDGELRDFYSGTPGETFSGFHEVTKDRAGNVVCAGHTHKDTVRVRTIDAIARERGQPVDMIVLQINGAEREALQGASETLRRNRPVLFVTNYHTPEGGSQSETIRHELKDEGYRVIASSATSQVFWPRERN